MFVPTQEPAALAQSFALAGYHQPIPPAGQRRLSVRKVVVQVAGARFRGGEGARLPGSRCYAGNKRY